MEFKAFKKMRDKREKLLGVVEAIDSLLEIEAKVDNADNLSLDEQEELVKEVAVKLEVLAVKVCENNQPWED